MSALNTQVVGELAASLEGAVRVATIVVSAAALALTFRVLVGSMTALHAEVMSELASGLEGAIRITLEVVSARTKSQATYVSYAEVTAAGAASGVVVSRMASLSAQLFCEPRALGEGAVWVAVGMVGVAGLVVSTMTGVTTLSCDLLQLILGKVGEVGWVAGCHFEVCC